MISHLSYSSIKRYLDCGRSWRHHYIDQLDAPKAASLVFGSAWHKMISRAIGGQSLPDAWKEAWNAEANGDIDWQGSTPEQLFNDGMRMIASENVQQAIAGLQPTTIQGEVATEMRVSLDVPGVPVPLIGYIDYIGSDNVATDFKTAGKSWTQDTADRDLQATIYIAALNQLGLLPLPARFRFIVFVKLKAPKVQILETTRGFEDILRLYSLVGDVWRSMQHQIFIANNQTWKCSPKYCEFFSICRGGIIRGNK